jgi:hypothetical protein
LLKIRGGEPILGTISRKIHTANITSFRTGIFCVSLTG